MAKVQLFIRKRKQGARVESIPVKSLVLLSGYPKKRWSYEDGEDGGWLILEGF